MRISLLDSESFQKTHRRSVGFVDTPRVRINVVSVLQPEGWDAFTAGYTELADAEADGYAVKLNVDKSEVDELIDGAEDSYSYAIIHFGK